MRPVLEVRIADHPLDLLPELVDALRAPPEDVFATDWVVVPSLGVRAWLKQQLSRELGASGPGRHDGVAANIEFPFPGRLRWTILRAAAAAEQGSEVVEDDPWQEERLVWSVLEVLQGQAAELDERLVRTGPGVSLAARANLVASLFDTYNIHRPGMVERWASGEDVDAVGEELPQAEHWQPDLFRRVHAAIRTRFGVDELPSVRFAGALAAVRAGDADVLGALDRQVPGRLVVFGQSVWSGETGPVLETLAANRRVLALVPTPSVVEATRLARVAEGLAPPSPISWSTPRQPLSSVRHPILASWGVRPLETAVLMGTGGIRPESVGEASTGQAATLLGRLQADIRSGGEPGGPVAALDRTLQVHGAPGRTRQVEVLRDVIADLLDGGAGDGPPLTEADIAVVSHRLDEFAPVIGSVWGPSTDDAHEAGRRATPRFRYSIIDRSARSANPVIDGVAAMLELLPGRMDRSSVREFLAMRAVRERFHLDVEDLQLLDDWIEASGIRWGVDGAQRLRDSDLPASFEDHTWAVGLQQLVSGIAAGESLRLAPVPGTEHAPAGEFDLALGGVAITPVDDGRIDGATRVVDAVCALVEVRSEVLEQPTRTIEDWVAVLRRSADRLVAPERFADWQRLTLDRELQELVELSTAEGRPVGTPMTLGDLRRMLSPVLGGSSSRTRLGVGGISVARPSQLAGVPFRVICILGLDGDSLPAGGRSGDDLGGRVPFVGDRDVRGEARAELLSVLTTASDVVVVTHNSHNVRTNEPVPRAAVLDELLAAVGALTGERADEVVVSHPRQAFDPSNFEETTDRRPRSYDVESARAANVLRDSVGAASSTGGVLVAAPLDIEMPASVELEVLRRFHRSPVERFIRDVLAVSPPFRPAAGESSPDGIPIEVGSLGASAFGRRLVEVARTAGTGDVLRSDDPTRPSPAVQQVVEVFRAEGLLPPPALAIGTISEVATSVADLYDAAVDAGYGSGPLHEVQVNLQVGGRRLSGVVGRCTDPADDEDAGPVVVLYERPKGHLVLSLCLDLVVLTLVDPGTEWRGLLVTRKHSSSTAKGTSIQVGRYQVRGDSPAERLDAATGALGVLLDQFDRGHRSPLPLFPETSANWVLRGRGPAAKSWGDPRSFARGWEESVNSSIQLAFGVLNFEELRSLDAAGTTFEREADATWGTLRSVVDGLGAEVLR